MKQTISLSVFLLLFITAGGVNGVEAQGRARMRPPVLYVALGASDAAGRGASGETRGYVSRIERTLTQCGVNLSWEMLGISGAQADKIASLEVPAALPLSPDLITLWAGPEDLIGGRSAEDFATHLHKILTQLKSKTGAFIVMANVPDMTRLPAFKRDPNPNVTAERIAAFNGVIKKQAELHAVTLTDLSAIDVAASLVSDADGFHPNEAGYQKIAEAFLSVIKPRYCR